MQHRAALVLLFAIVSCRFWVHSTEASSHSLASKYVWWCRAIGWHLEARLQSC